MAKTIKHTEDGQALWGDADHLEIAQSQSFTELIFELLSERAPSPAELKIFELILNLSIDHGPDTPSAVKVMEAAKNGEDMSKAVASGIEQIGDVHGGAAEPLMKELYRIKNQESGVKDVVAEYVNSGKKMPGLGHRIYKDKDPRAELIFQTLGGSEFTDILKEIQQELVTQSGKSLPINVDGAIAAALCTMGFEPRAGKAIFIIARTPGLIGQYLNHS